METASKILNAFQMHNWYAFAAFVQMLILQIVRTKNIPFLTNLWYRVPDGWRWLGPMLLGGSTAFVTAFSNGLPLKQALVAIVGGFLAIGFPSMGMHAAVKESPIPLDGGAGGHAVVPE